MNCFKNWNLNLSFKDYVNSDSHVNACEQNSDENVKNPNNSESDTKPLKM